MKTHPRKLQSNHDLDRYVTVRQFTAVPRYPDKIADSFQNAWRGDVNHQQIIGAILEIGLYALIVFDVR